MARDVEAKKLTPWADSGDRQDPEDAGLDRAAGWTVAYEQAGSGNYPERLVFNQLMRELSGLFQEALGAGVMQWSAGVDYRHTAFVGGSDGFLHVSLRSSGPATGDAEDPAADGQTTWRIY